MGDLYVTIQPIQGPNCMSDQSGARAALIAMLAPLLLAEGGRVTKGFDHPDRFPRVQLDVERHRPMKVAEKTVRLI